MQKLLVLTTYVLIGTVMIVCSGTLIERDVNAQNMTNANSLTGIENDRSSASVTARLNL